VVWRQQLRAQQVNPTCSRQYSRTKYLSTNTEGVPQRHTSGQPAGRAVSQRRPTETM